jgi:adenylate cyclase class IV
MIYLEKYTMILLGGYQKMYKKIDGQVKFLLDDFCSMSYNLVANDAVFIGGSFETTTRYDTINDKYSNEGIYVRTKSGFRNTLTLKEKSDDFNNNLFSRYITEIEIENIEDITYILEKIGLNKKIIMEKYRMNWILDGINLSIDELPFGIYLEIKGSDEEIKRIIKKLNIKSKRINITYWDIYEKDYKKSEDDIKFKENHIFKTSTYI